MAGIAVSATQAARDALAPGIRRAPQRTVTPTAIANTASTTHRLAPAFRRAVPAVHAAPVVGAASARANSVAVAKRSSGSRPSAFATAASIAGGTVSRSTATEGAGSLNRFAMTDWGVFPLNGGAPASIS